MKIKRIRRTKAEMQDIRDGLVEIVRRQAPMTVRQVFYQATVAGLVPKTEKAYKDTIARLLLQLRRSGAISHRDIADNTRWMYKPSTYIGLAAFMARHQNTYRRDLWAESDDYVEIWCEKEALAGVINPITFEYDVPLYVSRGFASESYLFSAADNITDELAEGKNRAIVYYFGDYDPSGLKISASIEAGLRRLAGEMWGAPLGHELFVFHRVAITEEQRHRLPSRPTKTEGNRHAKDWDGGTSVELDAMPPEELRALVRTCIERHVDQSQLEHLRRVEAEERKALATFDWTRFSGGEAILSD